MEIGRDRGEGRGGGGGRGCWRGAGSVGCEEEVKRKRRG